MTTKKSEVVTVVILVTVILLAKIIASIEEAMLIAPVLMAIGVINYYNTTKNLIGMWLVVLGATTMLFNLIPLFIPGYYLFMGIVLILSGRIGIKGINNMFAEEQQVDKKSRPWVWA